MKFRNLNAEDIECRVNTVSEKGCSLLLYKDARCDMKILDESVGSMNWKRSHELINGNLFCNVSIYDTEKKEWITKQDVGTESYTEKEKGQASDSFKRTCFNWGIGRELYTAPFIWINANDVTLKKNERGKYTTYDRFSVESMTVKSGVITQISIRNDKTNRICYRFSSGSAVETTDPTPKKDEPAREQEQIPEKKEPTRGKELSPEKVENIEKELERTGVDPGVILGMFHVNTYQELTDSEYKIIMGKFRKTKDKEVR